MQRRLIAKFSSTTSVVLLAALLGTGCALFGGGEEETAGGGSGSRSGGDFDSGDRGLGNDTNFGSSGSGLEGQKVSELETIYFDFDRATLRADAEAVMRHGEWRTVVVEGHCDERGSEEYNLALGERRAASVKQYLVDSGVASTRVDTVSFGESKPAVQGHDESAWRWNRRAEFRVIQ